MSELKPTIHRDALGNFEARQCMICAKMPSRHYCVHPDINGQEVFIYSGSDSTGSPLQKRCGIVFCISCIESNGGFESTTLCPFHHPESTLFGTRNNNIVTQASTQHIEDQNSPFMSQSTQDTIDSTNLGTQVTTEPTSIFTKTSRNNSLPEIHYQKGGNIKKRREEICNKYPKITKIKIGCRVAVKRGHTFGLLHDEPEKQKFISCNVSNDFEYFGTVSSHKGRKKYEIRLDVLPDPNNNIVLFDRTKIKLINPSAENELAEINKDCTEDAVSKAFIEKSKKKISPKEQGIKNFLSKGAEIIKSEAKYIHYEGTDNNKHRIDWEILGPNEFIEDDTFEFPSPPELNFDDYDLSDPGMFKSESLLLFIHYKYLHIILICI